MGALLLLIIINSSKRSYDNNKSGTTANSVWILHMAEPLSVHWTLRDYIDYNNNETIKDNVLPDWTFWFYGPQQLAMLRFYFPQKLGETKTELKQRCYIFHMDNMNIKQWSANIPVRKFPSLLLPSFSYNKKMFFQCLLNTTMCWE